MAEIYIERETPVNYAARVVWTLLAIVEGLLALRFILRLIAANPNAGFTDLIYSAAAALLVPFNNIVSNTLSGASGGVFEWTTLIAMAAYGLLAWAVVRLFFLSTNDDRVDIVDRM